MAEAERDVVPEAVVDGVALGVGKGMLSAMYAPPSVWIGACCQGAAAFGRKK